MKLKETVFKICEGVKSPISKESLTSLVLFEISKMDFFKDNYNHFCLVKNNDEIRILSAPLNNLRGITNEKLNYTLINPNYDNKDDISFLNDERYDSFLEEDHFNINNHSLYIEQSKIDNVNNFFQILEDSQSFEEVVEKIEAGKNVLLDLTQYVFEIQPSSLVNDIKPLFEIIKNIHKHNNSDGHFQLRNKIIGFGTTGTRDYFDCNAISAFRSSYDEKRVKRIIDDKEFREVEPLFVDDSTGQVPNEVREIFKNPEIDNFEAIKFYKDKDCAFKSLLFDAVFSDKSFQEKHYDIANTFFNEFKTNGLKCKTNILQNFKAITEITNDTDKLVKLIAERVINHYPALKNESVNKLTIKHYEPVGSYASSQQYKDLTAFSELQFYNNESIDNACKGFEYVQEEQFSFTKERDNFCIQLSNQNELLAFGSFCEDEGRLRINSVNVSNHHRGKGFIKDIYNELAKYAVKNNIGIETSMYSTKGESILPFIKRDILEKYPDLLWLDTCHNDHQTKTESLMAESNEILFNQLDKDDELKNVSMSLVRKIYDNEKKLLENKLEKGDIDYESEYEVRNNMGVKIISIIKDKNERNKSKKRAKNKIN